MNHAKRLCDLHAHSHYSDGTVSPAELVAIAQATGLAAVALTDHNTVSGLPEFVHAAKNSGVIAVPGVELSTGYGAEDVEIHMLGLFLPPESWPKVTEYVAKRNEAKALSNRACVDRLAEAGYAISYDEIIAGRENVSINRVHIAEALMQKGYIDSVKQAFRTLLSAKAGYYVAPPKLPVLEAIGKIREWGGVAVWAHPLLNLKGDDVQKFLRDAVPAGLQGMETRYSLFDVEDETLLDRLAAEFVLMPSGGSDFHGANKPDIALGTGKGSLHVPAEYWDQLNKSRGWGMHGTEKNV